LISSATEERTAAARISHFLYTISSVEVGERKLVRSCWEVVRTNLNFHPEFLPLWILTEKQSRVVTVSLETIIEASSCLMLITCNMQVAMDITRLSSRDEKFNLNEITFYEMSAWMSTRERRI
jgi:hypothetical protein